MRITYIFLFIVLNTAFLYGMQGPSPLPFASPPITFNVHLPAMLQNQTTNAQSSPTLHSNYAPVDTHTNNNVNNVETHTKMEATITNINTVTITCMVSNAITLLKDRALQGAHGLRALLSNHRYTLIATLLASAYGALVIRIVYDHHYLNNALLWGYWQKDKDDVYLLTHNALQSTNQLLIDIHQRYLLPNDPANSIMPLIHFLRDVEREEKVLTRFIRYTNLLDKKWLRRLFFLNKEKQRQARTCLSRLKIVKHLCTQWIAQAKIGHGLA